jgi:Fur family transcriptional regulator, ferric uptake regulator
MGSLKNSTAREEREVLAAHLASHGLKRSAQRDAVVEVFLRSDSHLSVDDLLQMVRKKNAAVGRTTVYRTLKLLSAAGLAQELHLRGETRFEREYKRHHHDHFICNSCGAIFEFSSDEIERAQDDAANEIGFVIQGHRHQIFGLCSRCAAKPASERAPGRPA